MKMDKMNKLERLIEQIQENEAIEQTRELIKIPSINGDEKAIAEYLSKELSQSGLSVEYMEAKKGRPNVIAQVGEHLGDDNLILAGHIDTVPVAEISGRSWDVDPFAGDVKNGCVYGLGSSDMKGGIASILLAIKTLSNEITKLNKGLTIIFCVDEERGSREGMKYLAENRLFKGKLALTAEPTNMKIQGWFKGRTWYEIETRGKAVHTSNSASGVNAIHHMVDIIHKINKNGFHYESHKFLGDCSVNFGRIEGGQDINTVPDLCKAKLEVRTVPGQTGESVKDEIIEYINEIKKIDSTFDASARVWEGWEGKDPMEISLTDPMIDRIQKASQKAIKRNLEFGKYGMGGGDLYFLWKNTGIPGIYFGPGNIELAHSPNEYAKIDNIVNAAKCYVAIILEFCEDSF